MSPSRNLERITGLVCHALLLVSHSSWVKGKAFFYYYFLLLVLLCHALLLVSHSSRVKGKAFFYYYFFMHEKSYLSILLPCTGQLTF